MAAEEKRRTVRTLLQMHKKKEPIAMTTAYDAPTAYWAEEAGVEVLLVGDSVGSVMLGYENTVPVTVDMILHHTQAVVRGSRRAFVVADLPFSTAHFSFDHLLSHASILLQKGGAMSVKIEGGQPELLQKISKLVQAGIPVMGHLGLLPQSVHCMGGYAVQGKDVDSIQRLMAEAQGLVEAGVFAFVLECVPEWVAQRIAKKSPVPVIGIGSGRYCDGQVLVLHDLLGMTVGRSPSFVKTYTKLGLSMKEGIHSYVRDVKSRQFPAAEHAFSLPEEVQKALASEDHKTKG